VLQQTAHQRVARVFRFAFHARRGLRPRQQHLRLDVDEGGRHDDELAGDVEVQLLHHLESLEILLRDERDRDVVDADLVLLDEVQQQIERALERLQLDRERVRRRFEVLVRFGHRYEIFIASRTRSMVCAATLRARREPSKRMSFR
jgi:hypothetical protein